MTPFRDLAEALTWVQERWEDEMPVRLHVFGEVEPDSALGSPKMHPGFEAFLTRDRNPKATRWEERDRPCHHDSLPCDDCHGAGMVRGHVLRYRHPMRAALYRLSRHHVKRLPNLASMVTALAYASWDWRWAAMRLNYPLDYAEAVFLLALRELSKRYFPAPLPGVRGISESQAIAEHEAA